MIDKFLAMLNFLPLRYVYDGNNVTHPYLKLEGLDAFLPEKIRYEIAPKSWGPIPGPHGPIPAPPTPAPPPAPAGDFYGKPTTDNQCQPGEQLFQVSILGGGVA